MMKRIAAVAAISLAAMQVLAGFTGVASAAGKKLGLQSHVAPTSTSCVVAAGIAVVQSTSTTIPAEIWTDGTYVYCNVDGDPTSEFGVGLDPKISAISSVIIYSAGDVQIDLQYGDATGAASLNRTVSYGGLKVTVDAAAALAFEAGGLSSPYGGNVTVTDTTFAGQGIVGTIYSASSVEYNGGGGTDVFDASAVSGDVWAWGNDGSDTLKSGSGDDYLYAGLGADKLYAGAGYDTVDCDDASDTSNDQCWAGAGDDEVYVGTHSAVAGFDVAAPGDGYDNVYATDAYAVTYADATVAVEFDGSGVYSDSGDDLLAGGLVSFTGSPKGDTLYGFDVINGGAGADVIIGTEYTGTPGSGDDTLSGGGGKDKIRSLSGDDEIYGDSGSDTIKGGTGDDAIYGGGGDDVLYGLGGVDFLKGGTGLDQTWGGPGVDTCSGEVRDSCEFRKG